MMFRLFFLVFILSFFSTSIQAEYLQSKSKKAEKYFTEALKDYKLGYAIEAELLLIKALKVDKNFLAAYILIATVKDELGYPLEAIDYYKKGLAINPDAAPSAYFYLAKIYFSQGMYSDALLTYKKCLSYTNISPRVREIAGFQLENCIFALEAIEHPVVFEPKNLGQNINSKKSEYSPSLTVDNNFFLFTRRLDKIGKGEQEDFIGSLSLNDSIWLPSYPLDELNTPFNEGAASLSADGKTLVFTACENYGDYGAGRQGFGSCDLFFAHKKGNSWGKPINMGPPINTSNWESQASLSADGRSIYFVRAPKKSQGHSDIYRADLDENGYWKSPVKLNSNINTDQDEKSVFIHPDNQTLYFSSNGHVGMGGMDLFMSKWDENKQEWGKAINLGFPINTYKDEGSILVAPDGELAYFASDRDEGFGALDLYSFHLPKHLQPEKITYFKGVVYNTKTEELLSAQFEIIDIESGKQISFSKSDEEDGSFLLTLNLGRNYLLNVSRPDYLFYSDQFLLKEAFSNQNPFLKDIPLQPIAVNEKVVLKNIFFKTDESILQETSEIELNKLILFLNNNPSVQIEIQGHTDVIGTAEHNLKLSMERAKSVYNFLIEHNIAGERLSYKGFGFNKAVSDNNTEEGRAQNRRTEFIITKL